ncbi:o-succinylbenzoate synthase [Bacillaceae bacterium SIJ1]|uniref:o-succinylbenzoate synthase n=1 Tax=Litoribacterium kuwaitense TaxID=1398745 RepID=UPI0013ED1333|nr:o-succinylbenzoate synthase [Litoribacterium kuwaitense]NGP43914.1 o-succinylbenzoate synthase [Litoribacterium kuwaitense]
MNIQAMKLHYVRMALKNPFVTHTSTVAEKPVVIVELIDREGNAGYGELVALPHIFYTEESVESAAVVLKKHLWPLFQMAYQQGTVQHPTDVTTIFSGVKRNKMAIAALEGAVWDLYAKQQQTSLSACLGGERSKVSVGVAIGQKQTTRELLQEIEKKMADGYHRVKLKISPGADIEIIRAVRESFPSLPLMADANSAYTWKDKDRLRQLDDYQLMMIEQPFAHDDLLSHARLQEVIDTPVCLDESIVTLHDVDLAITLRSFKVLNIKIGRVGGLTQAKQMIERCARENIEVWCGGMLEAGVGRAHNVALASISGVTLPGDLGSSSHYWTEDIIAPEIVVQQGFVEVPNDRYGIGFQLNQANLEKKREAVDVFKVMGE